MARDYLAIPASSVPSEQVFSRAGDIISKKRNHLEGVTIAVLMCLQSWFCIDEVKEAAEDLYSVEELLAGQLVDNGDDEDLNE